MFETAKKMLHLLGPGVSDPRAVPITSPLAAAGEAEELWISGYVSLRQWKLLLSWHDCDPRGGGVTVVELT